MTLAKTIRLKITVWLLTSMLLVFSTAAIADIAIPPLKAHITDLTATLSVDETAHLEQKLAAFEKTKGSQIAVLIIPTTQPETIEQYSIRVAEAWKLGRKGIDDGILLLIAKNDRALRIEVGYGLEGAIPDAMAKRIITEIITPRFKQSHFSEGIGAGIEAIVKLIQGEPLPPSKSMRSGANTTEVHPSLETFISILIGSIVLGRTLQVFLGRLIGATVTGLGVGFIGWLSFSSIAVAILITIVTFVVNLFLNGGSGYYRNGRSGWPNHGHYRSNDFGRGGGFGGGGGGFGGGGASGRW